MDFIETFENFKEFTIIKQGFINTLYKILLNYNNMEISNKYIIFNGMLRAM